MPEMTPKQAVLEVLPERLSEALILQTQEPDYAALWELFQRDQPGVMVVLNALFPESK